MVLTSIASSPSGLEVTGTRAPVEVIHLSTGMTIAEVPAAPTPVRIAVPPGRYVVRSVVDGRVLSREFDVRPGETVAVAGGQLEATGDPRIAIKGDDVVEHPPIDDRSTPPRFNLEWQVLLGVSETSYPAPLDWSPAGSRTSERAAVVTREFVTGSHLAFALTDRFVVYAPFAAAYRIGTDGEFEVIPFGGLANFVRGGSDGTDLSGEYSAGFNVRGWTGRHQSIIATVAAGATERDALTTIGALGYSATIGDAVTLNVSARAQTGFDLGVRDYGATADTVVLVGGNQLLAGRLLPLVEVHVSPRLALALTGSWGIDLRTARFTDSYMGGFVGVFK